MHFLLDANMPRSACDAVRGAGHECTHLRDTPLATASDELVSGFAREHGLALVTRDYDFSDERMYPPTSYPGIVVLSLPDSATATLVTRLLASFLSEEECVALLPGRLAIVEFGRIRLRPAPRATN